MTKTKQARPPRQVIDPHWQADQLPEEHALSLLWQTCNRAALNPWFIEWAIREYAGRHEMSSIAVAEWLGVTGVRARYLLGLCRRVDPDDPMENGETEHIARFVGAMPGKLGELLREAAVAAREWQDGAR